jgi:VIT1/CCC1 family predicted Fe2+/Mn2+ transporter
VSQNANPGQALIQGAGSANGAALQAPISADELRHHQAGDPHKNSFGLSDVILGGQDGLVNVLGVILGVAAATAETRIVLAAGLAATFAESVSMAAVAYTSKRAEQSFYESERQREYRHILQAPSVERDEIRRIYADRGFTGPLLEHVVDTITSDPDTWVAVMMAEEHRLSPMSPREPVRSAWVVGLAAIIGSIIPLAPFVLLPVGPGMVVSISVAALTLFVVGAYKARVTVGTPGRSGFEMALIGTLSALVGYAVGLFFRSP